MTRRVRAALKVRGEEAPVAFRLLALMVVSWGGAAIGANGVESLFFARFGPEFLPYLYLGLGVLTCGVMLVMGVLLARPDPTPILVGIPLGLSVVLLAARASLELDASLVYPALWLAMMVIWTTQGMASWALAGTLNDARQAKRLFPLFGAGLIVGSVGGGLGTGPLASWIGVENLVLVWAGTLVAMFALARAAVRAAPGRGVGRAPRRRRRGSFLREVGDGLRQVRGSPFLRWIALAMFLFAILYFTLALRFAEAATARFATAEELAGFLGLFMGASNAGALAVSLLVANRLFARFGVPAMVAALAAIYALGFAVLVSVGSFLVLVAFRFVQMVWVNGVWATGWQALFNVAPAERRARIRTFMDGVPLQGGIVVSGILLLLAQRTLSGRQLAVAGLAAAVVAVWAMWRARRAYGGALVAALREGNPEVFPQEEAPFGGVRADADAAAALVAAASDPDAVVRRVAVEILGGSELPDAAEALRTATSDPDPSVRRAALRGLGGTESTAEHIPVDVFLADPDPEVRALAAGLALRRSGDEHARAVLVGMLAEGSPDARRAAVEALGRVDGAEDVLTTALRDTDPSVRRAAAGALGRRDPARSLDPLVGALGDPDPGVRDAVAGGLARLGPVAVARLVEALGHPGTEEGALLGLLRTTEADAHVLSAYAGAQLAVASRYHDLWRRIAGAADDRLDLLAWAVRDRALRHALRTLRAVTAPGSRRGVEVALDGLVAPDVAERATALETLEAVGGAEVVRPAVAIWEAAPDGASDPGPTILALLRDDDPWLRACAAFAAGAVDDPDVARTREDVASTDPEPLVREAAGGAKERADVETLPTLSTMERVLFLRKVRLVADLAPEDLKHVAEICSEQVFSDGAVIAEQGEAGEELHIVVSGEIRVVVGGGGLEQEIARRGSGEYVGEMSILSREPRMASLIASGDVRTLSIDRRRFERILRDRPDASLAVIRVLCERLIESHSRGATGAGV